MGDSSKKPDNRIPSSGSADRDSASGSAASGLVMSGSAMSGFDASGAGESGFFQTRASGELTASAAPAPPPPAPRRIRRGGSFAAMILRGTLLLIVLGALGVGTGFWILESQFEADGPLRSPRSMIVREGDSLSTIAAQLENHGIVDSELIFRLGTRLKGASGRLQAGEYEFPASASMLEVLEAMVSGAVTVYKATFPEGLSVLQMAALMEAHPDLTGDLPEELPPEGSLMPDTYSFQRGSDRLDLLRRMQDSHERFVRDAWNGRARDLPLKSPLEMVILASIVEKETGKADERPRIAGVFVNRLRKGMRLQSDPTVIYGIFGGEGKPSDRPIFRSDLRKSTPYNTYVINGLPPTPIANPGRAAIEAVANPSRTDDLYFVADGTGGHAFAATLEEHNGNVKRWRAVEALLKRQREEREAEGQ